MNSKTIKNTFKGIGFSLLMAVGLVAFSNVEANAQYQDRNNRQDRREDRQDRRNDRDDRNDDRNNRFRNDLYRVAQENGFRDGRVYGREDRRDRDRDNLQRSREYKKATNGYYSRLGSKNDYRNAYRQAFLEGYNVAVNRRDGRNNRRRDY